MSHFPRPDLTEKLISVASETPDIQAHTNYITVQYFRMDMRLENNSETQYKP